MSPVMPKLDKLTKPENRSFFRWFRGFSRWLLDGVSMDLPDHQEIVLFPCKVLICFKLWSSTGSFSLLNCWAFCLRRNEAHKNERKKQMSCQSSAVLHPYASIISPRPLQHHMPHQEQQRDYQWVIKPLIALHGWVVFITALHKTWDSQIFI